MAAGPISLKPAPGPPADTRRRRDLARAIVGRLGRLVGDQGDLSIVLAGDRGTTSDPEGAAAAAPTSTRATVVIGGPDALGRLLFPPGPDALAEAYLRGDLDIEGRVMTAVEAGQAVDLRRLGPTDLRRVGRWAWELRRATPPAAPLRRSARLSGARHSRARDLAAVRFHYDVGNDFFGLWLDRRLAYSCAYFPEGTDAAGAAARLDEAQEAKLDLIARKLRLGPRDRFLDIGCGWGSLVGFVAERCGCRATGVTLSERQASEANARLAAAGPGALARCEVRDYRDLAPLGSFDAIASVGMFEHVGRANLPAYFRAAHDALRPGGLFLNHGIAAAGRPGRGALRPPGRRGRPAGFVDRYVFPDGELVPMEDALAIARRAGFEVLDVQSLRPHYALTLAAWVARLEAHWDEAVGAAGEEVARTWRLYLSAARLGFERGDLDVCQLLLARPAAGRPAELPLRPWW